MRLLITGSTGIAAAAARLAARHGDAVFVTGIDPEPTAALAQELRAAYIVADLGAHDAALRVLAACLEALGGIDALFNVAGISGRRFGDGPVHQCTDEGWETTLSTNLTTMFRMCRAVVSHWLEHGQPGAIVNMASVVALSPEPRFFATHAYAASKGAILSLTRAMAAYYLPHGIRVNALAPGLVRTPMSRRAQEDPDLLEFMKTKQPLAPMLEAEDVARTALFLLSEESRHVTGQILSVDAGWTLT